MKRNRLAVMGKNPGHPAEFISASTADVKNDSQVVDKATQPQDIEHYRYQCKI